MTTSEIVKRLRKPFQDSDASLAAADLIEALEAEAASLRQTLQTAYPFERLRELEAENKRLREALGSLFDAADGLSRGEDWNNGTHAKLHGYRKKLLAAIPAARAALRGEI